MKADDTIKERPSNKIRSKLLNVSKDLTLDQIIHTQSYEYSQEQLKSSSTDENYEQNKGSHKPRHPSSINGINTAQSQLKESPSSQSTPNQPQCRGRGKIKTDKLRNSVVMVEIIGSCPMKV